MIPMAWLASYPKSGNTWVRLLFEAYVTEKCDINTVLCSTSDAFVYPYQLVSPKPMDAMEPWEVAACASAAALHIPLVTRTRPLLIKTHHAFDMPFGYPVIPKQLCKKAVYLIRDPRDVAVSYAKHIGQSLDETIGLMGDESCALMQPGVPAQFLRSWSQHVLSWTSQIDIDILAVRYEDLLKDPVRVFVSILKHLEETPNHERVRRAVELSRLENLREQEKKNGFVDASKHTRFFGPGGSTWQTALSGDQAARLESDHSAVMQASGYLEKAAA